MMRVYQFDKDLPGLFGYTEDAHDIGDADDVIAVDLNGLSGAIVRDPSRHFLPTVGKQHHIAFLGA